MFRKTLLVAACLAMFAAPAAAETPFPDGSDARAKFAWVQKNLRHYCQKTRTPHPENYEAVPDWVKEGLVWADKRVVVGAIMDDCVILPTVSASR